MVTVSPITRFRTAADDRVHVVSVVLPPETTFWVIATVFVAAVEAPLSYFPVQSVSSTVVQGSLKYTRNRIVVKVCRRGVLITT